jgi:putative DNA primase/helicase
MLTAGEIAQALGGKRAGSNSFVARCPAHEDRTPSLSLTDSDGLTLWRCHAGCSQRDVRDALVAKGLWPRPGEAAEPARRVKPRRAPKPDNSGHSDYAGKIWRESVDPRGTLAEQYLRGRGLELDDDLAMRVLRFHGRCPFKDEKDKRFFVPAMIAAFRPICNDDETRPPPAIHRIGLNPDGSKIDKLMLGPVADCAVKLDADDMVEQGLGVCEGIETGLAIRATGWKPIWALGSAGAIAKLEPIPGIDCLTIFADHDENDTGIVAARECARRWVDAGCDAFVRTPKRSGRDWADD